MANVCYLHQVQYLQSELRTSSIPLSCVVKTENTAFRDVVKLIDRLLCPSFRRSFWLSLPSQFFMLHLAATFSYYCIVAVKCELKMAGDVENLRLEGTKNRPIGQQKNLQLH